MVQYKDERKKFRTEMFKPLTDSQWQDIEKFFNWERKRKYCLRKILDYIRKVDRTGTQWRNLFSLEEKPYCTWMLVYYYFRKWQKDGTWDNILTHLVEKERVMQGRERQASACAVDSQSVKTGTLIHLEKGIDGGNW